MNKVLVIGAGGAGLSAAISAKEAGSDVVVVTKEYPTRSQTSMAQGGINAVLDSKDTIQNHIKDTIKAAKGLCDKRMVELLCTSAPKAIKWLDSIGVVFSRSGDAKIAQRKLGGATHKRACYAQDYTGLKILHTLYDYANKLDIEFLNEKFLLELLIKDGRCFGGVFYDIKTGKTQTIYANSVILAGGGYSKIYGAYSTNSKSATGDIIAVAKRAGCKLSNMEFIQFHPTALKSSSILISESARGAGGKLFNSKNERFVDELLPRDEVSLAIFEQIEQGLDVFLDITHLGEEFIDEELPQERKLAILHEGVDPTKERLPIKPSAHFTMGGIKADENMQTNIENLFAVGECAEANIHGANRLGGNALLEIVAFGNIAGKNASTCKNNIDTSDESDKALEFIKKIKSYECRENFYIYKNEFHKLMYEKCGIKRNAKALSELLDFIQDTQNKINMMGIKDKSDIYNTNLVDFLEFLNTLEVAKEVVLSALANKKSIGAHYRTDTE